MRAHRQALGVPLDARELCLPHDFDVGRSHDLALQLAGQRLQPALQTPHGRAAERADHLLIGYVGHELRLLVAVLLRLDGARVAVHAEEDRAVVLLEVPEGGEAGAHGELLRVARVDAVHEGGGKDVGDGWAEAALEKVVDRLVRVDAPGRLEGLLEDARNDAVEKGAVAVPPERLEVKRDELGLVGVVDVAVLGGWERFGCDQDLVQQAQFIDLALLSVCARDL
jgi:hypothetical protein